MASRSQTQDWKSIFPRNLYSSRIVEGGMSTSGFENLLLTLLNASLTT